MKFEVIDFEGNKTGRSVDFPDALFASKTIHEHLMHFCVKQFLASQRQGTAKVKGRSEVKGSTRKLHKQKGTGGSRKGNLRNPLYKGGGVVHGPQPKSYDFKINKQEKYLAKVSALSVKVKSQELLVMQDFNSLDNHKTSSFVEILKKLKISNKKSLFVQADSFSDNIIRSSQNLSNVLLSTFRTINVYDILNSDFLVFSETLAEVFKKATSDEVPTEKV